MLDISQVREVERLLSEGITIYRINRLTNISKQTIKKIKSKSHQYSYTTSPLSINLKGEALERYKAIRATHNDQ
jgi:hypothetical protein